jgi:hypothetical protein
VRYAQTNCKKFISQIAKLKHRQHRLRYLRERLEKPGATEANETAYMPDAHHLIVKSQNDSEHIGLFVQKHAGDPAVKGSHFSGLKTNDAFDQYIPEDFVPKLKKHLLSGLRESIRQERNAHVDDGPEDTSMTNFAPDRPEYEQVIIRKELMYKHKLAKFNYTAYDVRRAQDVINPGTSRCNVMVLSNAQDEENPNADRFAYARVIGVFHVNAILAGHDYRLRRLEFLWVRWYQSTAAFRWDSFKLEQVNFPPMADDDAFGFIDPRDVVRACHLVPKMSTGQVHSDGIGLSKLAKDYRDWRSYFINWYVSRPQCSVECESLL